MDNPKQDGTTIGKSVDTVKPMPGFSAIEKLAGIILANRFIWLVLLIAWASIAHISYWQVLYPRFDTFDLLAHISVILEMALVGIVVIILASFPVVQAVWEKRFPGHPYNLPFAAVAGGLCTVLLFALLIAPVLFFHRYPELVEHDVRVPLMLMQRYLFVLLTVLLAYNTGLILRLYFRFSWWLSGLFALLSHSGVGYWVTWVSFTNEQYARLNDVFYYNMLAERFEWFPELSQQMIYHNIEPAFFNHYFSIAATVLVVSFILWLPKAIAQTGSPK